MSTGEYQVDCFNASGQLIPDASFPSTSLCRSRQLGERQLKLHADHVASFRVMRCIFDSLDEPG